MEKRRASKEKNKFYDQLKDISKRGCFLDFDTFMIREMGFFYESKEELELVRRKAMKKFRRQTGHYPFASLPTIRKWFGIGGFARPKREQVFKICLILGVGIDGVKRYLKLGLAETSVHFSNYREVIWLYGIKNKLTCKMCKDMIARFEKLVSAELPLLAQRKESLDAVKFEQNSSRSPEKFIKWMVKNVRAFTGYNQKMMDCICDYKKIVMELMRKEAVERLDSLLAETDFKYWMQMRKINTTNRWELIKRYVNSRSDGKYYKISQNMRDNILELSKITYSGIDANSRLLAEVFSSSVSLKKGMNEMEFRDIRSMSGKHLSDMLNVPEQNYRALKIKQVQIALNKVKACPEWARQIIQEFSRDTVKLDTMEEIKSWLEKYEKEQHRRCVQVRRSDVLPMAHYVAQHRYLQQLEDGTEDYEAEYGRRTFIEVANQMLRECDMAEVSEEFELDNVLLTCFQPDEMYSYTDVLIS